MSDIDIKIRGKDENGKGLSKEDFTTIFKQQLQASNVGGNIRTRIVEFLGDSITDQSTDITGTSTKFNAHGFATWVRGLCLGKIECNVNNILGIGGSTTGTLITNQLPDALISNASISVLHIGTNDIAGNIPINTTIANFDIILEALTNAGKLVILVPPIPRASGAAFTVTQSKRHSYLLRNLYEKTKRNKNIFIADIIPYVTDVSTGNTITNLLTDGVHPGVGGAYLLGKSVADVINKLIPPIEGLMFNSNDVFDATENPTGNILTNGLLVGSDGSLLNGSTGTPPTSWTGRLSATSTTTAVFSKENDTSIVGLTKTVITLGGTGSNQTIDLRQSLNWSIGINAGDNVVAEIECEFSGLTNVNGCSLELYSSGTIISSYDFFVNGNNGTSPSSGRVIMKTPPLTIPSGSTQYVYNAFIRVLSTGNISGTVKWSRATLRKVII